MDSEVGAIMLSSCISAVNHDHRLPTILTIRAWRKGTIQS